MRDVPRGSNSSGREPDRASFTVELIQPKRLGCRVLLTGRAPNSRAAQLRQLFGNIGTTCYRVLTSKRCCANRARWPFGLNQPIWVCFGWMSLPSVHWLALMVFRQRRRSTVWCVLTYATSRTWFSFTFSVSLLRTSPKSMPTLNFRNHTMLSNIAGTCLKQSSLPICSQYTHESINFL